VTPPPPAIRDHLHTPTTSTGWGQFKVPRWGHCKLPLRRAPESSERIPRGPQVVARLCHLALAPQPQAVGELEPRALERPPCEVSCERLLVAVAGVRGIRQDCFGMSESEGDPGARLGANGLPT